MQIKILLMTALAVITMGCNDDAQPDRDPVEVPGDGDGDVIDPDDEGDVGQPGEEFDHDDPESDGEELDPDDDWIATLDYAIAWAIDDGFKVAGYDSEGEEIGWIVVVASPEIIVLEHRYYRPCEFDEFDCFDAAATLFTFADEPKAETGHTIPLDVAQRRAKALIVLAQQQEPQPNIERLKQLCDD